MGDLPGSGGCKSPYCLAWLRRAFAAALLAAGLPHAALADVINVVAGGSATRDSNIFRRPDALADTTMAAYAGLRVDVPYSLQRFQLDVTRTAYRHNDLGFLDFDGTDYRGAWLWSLTPRVTGSLTADRAEAQVPFLDFQGTQRNVRRIRNEAFQLDALLGYGLHLLAAASHSQQTSSVPFVAQTDFRIARIEGGLRYVLPAGHSISLVQRTGQGEYINRVFDPLVPLDTDFKENETEVQGTWLLGGRSTLSGRLSHLERRHAHLSQLDSSGFTGEVNYAWIPTGKLNLGVFARRSLVPYFDVLTTHRIDKSIGITPRWQATDHLAVTLAFARTQSEFLGATTIPGGAARKDTYNAWNLGMSWTPARAIVLNAGYQRLRRASNDPAFPFDARITTLGAALTF